MGTDIEKLVDLMIQERMQSQFAKWREAETGKEKKADYLHWKPSIKKRSAHYPRNRRTL
ncbi:hypothetical protein [Roseburia sp. TF10-5]|uniref:hypothetical protein n=1 Tax=Roseburia sp. TF10-5 TaxID=2293144 RepID=UPI0013142AD8|nr:hypothetical protein [Roseburia sp. TF10-5]